jgi:hypothetical protein
MIYEVYYIENIGFQPVTIYVEPRSNSPIFQSADGGSQVTIQIRKHITCESDRIDLNQIRNMQRLKMIQASLRTQQAPTVRFTQVEIDFGDGEWVNPNRDVWTNNPLEMPYIENDTAIVTVSDS